MSSTVAPEHKAPPMFSSVSTTPSTSPLAEGNPTGPPLPSHAPTLPQAALHPPSALHPPQPTLSSVGGGGGGRPLSLDSPMKSPDTPTVLSSLATPTPASGFSQAQSSSAGPSPSGAQPAQPSSSPSVGSPVPTQAQATDKRTSRASLVSSRPAPPSPAGSRRASTLSMRNSRPTSQLYGSIRGASASDRSRPGSMAPPSPLAMQTTFGDKLGGVRKRVPPVHVRDFGFDDDDERRGGHGQFVPKPNRRHQRRSSTSSTVSQSSASEAGSDAEEEDEEDEAGGMKWGWGALSSAMGGGGGWVGGRVASWASAAGPSQSQLSAGFLAGADSPSGYASPSEEGSEDYADEEVEIVPGLYKALYTFEPEGSAEMALEEGQLVRVVAQGGGAGWAVARRPQEDVGGEGLHGLVPAGYLELVRPDEDEDGEGVEVVLGGVGNGHVGEQGKE